MFCIENLKPYTCAPFVLKCSNRVKSSLSGSHDAIAMETNYHVETVGTTRCGSLNFYLHCVTFSLTIDKMPVGVFVACSF